MSSLIFFIFMIWFIMRIVKNKQKAAGQNDPETHTGQQYTWLCCNPHGKHLFHSGRQCKKIRL